MLFLVAAAIISVLGLQDVARNDWNPTTLLRVGTYTDYLILKLH